MAARKFNDLRHFSLGNLECENSANTHTVPVDMQHDLDRVLAVLVEESLENVNNKLHRRVVVVEDEDLVEAGFLGLRARFCDQTGPGSVTAVAHSTVARVSHALCSRNPFRGRKIRALYLRG